MVFVEFISTSTMSNLDYFTWRVDHKEELGGMDPVIEFLKKHEIRIVLIVSEISKKTKKLHYHGICYGDITQFRNFTQRGIYSKRGKGNKIWWVKPCNFFKDGVEGGKRYLCKGRRRGEGPIVIEKDEFIDIEAYHNAYWDINDLKVQTVEEYVEAQKKEHVTVPIWLRARVIFNENEEECKDLAQRSDSRGIGVLVLKKHREKNWCTPNRTHMFEIIGDIMNRGSDNYECTFDALYTRMF